jgi:hypothetical protein
MIASVNVGTTEVQVLAVPTGKPYSFIAIGNNGSQTAYLKMTPDSTAVTSSNGIPLSAGASLLCDQDREKELFHGRVTAVVSNGTTTLSVQAY